MALTNVRPRIPPLTTGHARFSANRKGVLARARGSPFAIQAALVLLPVFLLAGVGCWLLEKDRRMAQREAVDSARDAAEAVAWEIKQKWSGFLCSSTNRSRLANTDWGRDTTNLFEALTKYAEAGPFQVWRMRRDGSMAFPPPLLPVWDNPGMAKDDSIAAALYRRAQHAEHIDHDSERAASLYDLAGDSEESGAFRSLALYAAALAHLSGTNQAAAARRFYSCWQTAPAGAEYVAQLAGLKLLSLPGAVLEAGRITEKAFLLSNLLSKIAFSPTIVSGEILAKVRSLFTGASTNGEMAGISLVESHWKETARTRGLARNTEVLSESVTNSVVMVMPGEEFLLIEARPAPDGEWQFTAVDRETVRGFLASLLQKPDLSVPRHFAVNCEVENIIKVFPNRVFTPLAKLPLVADAPGFDGHRFKSARITLTVGLRDTEAYFAAQKQRTQWFLALIAAASGVALAGLAVIWRGMVRLQRLGELKSGFVASVSHELRAPLASVRLLGESLARGKITEPGRQQEYYHVIVQECRRLGSLVENLLSFARHERGNEAELESERVDLVELARESAAILEGAAREKGVVISVTPFQSEPLPLLDATLVLAPAPPTVDPSAKDPLAGSAAHGDSRALLQVFLNLLDNALKFSPRESSITITTGAAQRFPGLIAIAIRDRGPGIPVAEHRRIFEMFYRMGSEMTRETPGVGIGLGLVHQIVSRHGGGICLESSPGKGACFTILLPSWTGTLPCPVPPNSTNSP